MGSFDIDGQFCGFSALHFMTLLPPTPIRKFIVSMLLSEGADPNSPAGNRPKEFDIIQEVQKDFPQNPSCWNLKAKIKKFAWNLKVRLEVEKDGRRAYYQFDGFSPREIAEFMGHTAYIEEFNKPVERFPEIKQLKNSAYLKIKTSA